MSPAPCAACGERRLRAESLAVKIAGLSIADFTALPLTEARKAVDRIRERLTLRQRQIAGRPLAEIAERLDFLLAVGLGYLTLDRSAATLSGARRSGFGWRRRSDRGCAACFTCWTSPRSGCTRATTSGC